MTVNEKGLVEAALLPCPLCGSPAFMDGQYWVCCNNGDCQTSTRPFDTEADAIAAWNRRAASSDAEPVAWLHPSRAWAHHRYDEVAMHCCGKDGPQPIPLYPYPFAAGRGGAK